jgi:Putative zinc-finger
MCDYSGKLIAWMDRELPDSEAADVGRHIRACAECQGHVDAYEQVSASFVAYCDAASGKKTPSRLRYWVPVLSGVAAAAVLALVFMRVPVKQIPVRPQEAMASPASVMETVPRPVKAVHRQRSLPRIKTPNASWTPAGPAIQIVIPAEAMFPPGAVPEGINFIADLDIAADGSAQGLRLQP